MIVIDKKRITLIITGIFLSIFIFVFTKDNISEQKYYKSTTSLPISGKTIVIDAGHGKPDERSCLLTLKITLIFYKK